MSNEEFSPEAPALRLCHVRKRFPEEEYGFNLHAEKGKSQFIGKVDANSPAQVAGLQQGDRIIGVNGVLIAAETHKQVVSRIKQNPLETTLLVIDEVGMAWYEQRNIRLAYDLPRIVDCSQSKANGQLTSNGTKSLYVPDSPTPTAIRHQSPPDYEKAVGTKQNGIEAHHDSPAPIPDISTFKPRPRLSKLVKTQTTDEYGFNLHADRGKGHFVGKVDPDSIAELSGLEQGQRIVGVNGTLIYPNTPHKDVVALIRQVEMRTELLLASAEVDEFYRKHNLEFSFDHSEQLDNLIVGVSRISHFSPAANGHFNSPTDPISHTHESTKVLRGEEDLVVHQYHHNGDDHSSPKLSELPSPSTESSSSTASTHRHNDFRPNDGGHIAVRNGVVTNGSYSSPDSFGSTSRSPETPGLDPIFTLTAAQLKEKLALRKKKDAKKEQMTFKEKYEIVKNL